MSSGKPILERTAFAYKWTRRWAKKNGVRKGMKRVIEKTGDLQWHTRKKVHQRSTGTKTTKPVFIVGCQRSGNTMLLDVLDKSPETWVEDEAWHSAAFLNYRLRPPDEVSALLRRSNARATVFKSLCDSQCVDDLLARYPGGRAIWLYRDYRDVAGSCSRRWGGHLKDVMGKIVNGDTVSPQWRSERLYPETVEQLKDVWSPDVSDFEGAVLFWYLRNRLYFDLGLQDRGDVTLVCYEDIVMRPNEAFPPLFAFIGSGYRPEMARDVFTDTVGQSRTVELRPEIQALCDDLLERLKLDTRRRLGFMGGKLPRLHGRVIERAGVFDSRTRPSTAH